ncbi:MAG: FkbM family methyltransferase [Aggregatilineales bacterium]
MTWKTNVFRAINRVLNHFSLEISRYSDLSLQAAFERFVQRPVSIASVIDVGASDGRWSARVMRYYPRAHYLLVEANVHFEPKLREFVGRHQNASYALVAAGPREGIANFHAPSDPLGGLASEQPIEHAFAVPMTTIDRLSVDYNLPAPYLIKLDTHGFEVPILAGAREALKRANMLIIEVYNFRFTAESVLFYHLCQHLEALGFRPVDLIEPVHRPFDAALWQFDLVFVPADRPEFSVNQFAAAHHPSGQHHI